MSTAYSQYYPISASRLPDDWTLVTVGDVTTEIRNGFSSPTNNSEGRGLLHLRPMNISRFGKLDFGDSRYVEPTSDLRLEYGDVIFNNTNSVEHVGKSALYTLEERYGFSNHLTRLRVTPSILPEFLAHQLLLLYRTGYFRVTARQHVNQASISNRTLARSIPLVLAPMTTQIEVCSLLKSRFQRVDSIASIARGVLENLFGYESETLRRAVEESPQRHGKRPDIRVEDAGEVQLGKKREPSSHEGENMLPYLRVANVRENAVDLSDLRIMHFSVDEVDRYCLRAGDVLLNEGQSADLVGRPAMYRGGVDQLCFQMTLLRFRANSGYSPTFALLLFRHYLRSGRFRETARWTTNLAHLTARRFKMMPFPDLTLAEQEVVVEETNSRLQKIEALRTLVEGVVERADAAYAGVLRGAFHADLQLPVEGEIEPVDEPTQNRSVGLRKRRTVKRRPIFEALREHPNGLSPSDLFEIAGFTKEAVEEFYLELRTLVSDAHIVEDRVGAEGERRLYAAGVALQ